MKTEERKLTQGKAMTDVTDMADQNVTEAEAVEDDKAIAEEEAITRLNKELKKEQAKKARIQAREARKAKKAKRSTKEEKQARNLEEEKRTGIETEEKQTGKAREKEQAGKAKKKKQKDSRPKNGRKRGMKSQDISSRLSAITGFLIFLSYAGFILIVMFLTGSIVYRSVNREMYLTVNNSSVKLESSLLNAKQGDSFDTKFLSLVTNDSSDFPSLQMAVLNRTGDFLYSENEKEVGKNCEEVMPQVSQQIISGIRGRVQFKTATASEWSYFVPMNAAGRSVWLVGRISTDEVRDRVLEVLLIISVVGIIALVSLTLLIRFMIKKSLRPLVKIQDVASEIAKGNFDVSIQYDRQDEIGRLASALQDFIDRLRRIINDIGKRLSDFSDGNLVLDDQNKEYYIGAYASIRTSIEEIADGLNHTISEIRHASDQVATGSSQVSSGAQSLAQSSTEQASSIEELSQTMQNVSDKISNTTEMTNEAALISKGSEDAVSLTNAKMKEMTSSMEEITGKANEISKIIQTIDDIAFQTNILALNASIEAARAGSAGKGFAVVAGEVGNLAKKSQEAAQGTAKLIEDTIAAVGKGAAITSDTESALEKVSDSFIRINKLISRIQTASEEENERIKQAADGLNQISAVVQTNSATAEESAAAAEALSSQAETMKELVGVFRLDEKK